MYLAISQQLGYQDFIWEPLFQLVSIPASIATTGIHSDIPYEHVQYQGWNIGWNIEKYSTPTEQSDWSILRAYVINTYK